MPCRSGAEVFTPLQELELFIKQYEFWLLAGTGGTAVVGLVLLLGGVLDLILAQGQPMSHEEVEDLSRRTRFLHTGGVSFSRLWGKTAGRQAEDTFSLQALKEMWRTGAWWCDPIWRRRMLATTGGVMLMFGLLGFLFVVGPPAVKVLTGGALLYALIRVTLAFRRT